MVFPKTTWEGVVRDPNATLVWLIELYPVDEGQTPQELYYASETFRTRPAEDTDVPLNQEFEGRVDQPFRYDSHLFGPNGQIGGRTVPCFGDVEIINADGEFDGRLDWGWDDRTAFIKLGGREQYREPLTYSEYRTMFQGVIVGAKFDEDRARFRIRCWKAKIDNEVLTTSYGGTGGWDGTASRVGILKPALVGEVLKASPVEVDAAAGLYQFDGYGAIEDVTYLEVGGVAYTITTNPNPSPNHYYVDHANGGVIIGGAPVLGQIRADVRGRRDGGGVWIRSLSGIVTDLLEGPGGLLPSEIDQGDLSSLETTVGDPTLGYYLTAQTTVNPVLSDLLNSVGAFSLTTAGGPPLNFGQFQAPSGTPDHEFDDEEIIRVEVRENVPPIWKLRVGYAPEYSTPITFVTQSGQDVSFDARQFRYTERQDASILDQHPKAGEMVVKTSIDNLTDAQYQRDFLWDLYSVERRSLRVTVKAGAFAVMPNNVVRITYSRFELEAGKLFRVLNAVFDAKENEVRLELWG